MGRNRKYELEDAVRIAPQGRTKLQADSDRRAVINYLIECGGMATLQEINEWFGYDISQVTRALINVGWLEVVE